MKEKEPRELSGIYFRYRNTETGKMENRVFEDLPETEQDRILADKDPKWIKSLAKQLANTITSIGNQFDIKVSEDEDSTDN